VVNNQKANSLKLRTEIKLRTQQQNQIDYTSKILLLGSCFSENIGSKLTYYKFDTLINPFGVLFTPTAIEKVIQDAISQKKYDVKDLVLQNGLYHSLHHHSDISDINAEQVLNNIDQAQKSCLEQLKTATHIILTLGTSWIYQYCKTEELVANCHKIPQAEFTKKLLSISEIENSLQEIIKKIRKVNLNAQIIFTLSPVRHTKDGVVENSLSKAQLLSAVHKIRENHHVTYFGSYEIMMDDLRDYRFYESDLIHPNTTAINYIWEQFSNVWIIEKAKSYFKRIASVQQSKLHKPFHQNSEAHQQFLDKLAVKQTALEQELHVKF